MPENTNAQVIYWANNRVRPLANAIIQLKYAIDGYVNDYSAQGIAALINAVGASEVIADGSDQDGRPQITGTMVEAMQTIMLSMQTNINTTVVSGVGVTPYAGLSTIQTNASPNP